MTKPVVISLFRYHVITSYRHFSAKLRKNSFAAKPFRFISHLRTLRKPLLPEKHPCVPCARHFFFHFPLAQPAQASFLLKTSLRTLRKLFFDFFIKKCAFALRVSYKFAIFAPVFRKESGSNITELPHRRRNEPNNIHKSVCALCAGVSAVNVGCGKPR